VSHYQKGKTNLDFTEARDSEWQWHPLGHMQICTLLQTDNHASTPPLSFLQAGCPSCHPCKTIKRKQSKHEITHFSVSGGSRLLEKSTVFRPLAEEKKSVADAGLSLVRRLIP